MTGYNKNALTAKAQDYANLRSLPAILSVLFLGASLYQFGGISAITLTWLGGTGGYSLTAEHSVMVSMATLLVAFMSSQTKSYEHYEVWEMLLIAAGPLVIVGDYLTVEVTDVIVAIGDPLGYQVAFFLTVLSWGAAIR